jgi:tetratricopeptide (TPR) repeat protein
MNQMKSPILYIAFFFWIFAGCAHKFKVQSEPIEADVYFLNPKSQEKKLVGKTPLELPMSEIREKVGDEMVSGEFLTVLVEKAGHVTQTFLLPAAQFGTLVTELNVPLAQGTTPKEERFAKSVLDRLFLAQKFALSQQYERALIELDKILTDFPGFARALSMKASIYFAQKNFTESLKFYEQALAADPQMEDAVKMVAKVKALQSGRDPAATAPRGP